MIGLDFQAALIENTNAGHEGSALAIVRLLEIYDLGELVMVDGLLAAAERWIRLEIAGGSNANVLTLCGVLVVKAAKASHDGSMEAAISYVGEALCLLDMMADAGDVEASANMAKLTDWVGSSDFGKAAVERAKAMRAEVTF